MRYGGTAAGFTPAEAKAPSTVAAWSRTLYKYDRGHTLAGQARPGRMSKLAHENTRTQFKEFKQAVKEATSNGAKSTRVAGQRTEKQRKAT